jgi:hypothetical protein
MVLVPAPEPLGENAAVLDVDVEFTEKLLADEAPFNVQANVNGKLAADEPLAVKFKLPVSPTDDPVAAGVCDEQVGGVFFTTVQVCVAVLDPLLTVATSVLLPVLRAEDKIA